LNMKNQIIQSIVFITILIISSPYVEAANYYVDINHSQASDSNTGTESLPWKTIGHAASVAVAGDTIYVKAGTYSETVTPSNNGTSDNKIIFKASTRRSVTVNRFNISKNFIRVEGFQITHNTVNYGISITGNNVEVVDNYLYNIQSAAIGGSWTPKTESAYIANNYIFHCRAGIYVEGNNWLVENNEIERLYDYTGADCDYVVFFGENHIFRKNYFHGTILSEIGSSHVDCFQTYDSSTTGRYTKNVLIEKNRCFDWHEGFMGEAHNLKISSNITFRNNVFARPLTGYQDAILVQDIPYVTVINNTFALIGLRGVGISKNSNQLSKYAIVKNNIFYDMDYGYTFQDDTSSGDYNIMYLTENNPNKGPHDVVGVDPLFIDLNNNDFRLQSGSPACNAGEGGTYIGAYGCSAGSPSTPRDLTAH
jgi:hypothetical protein